MMVNADHEPVATATPLSIVSSGADWFEWVIQKHCSRISISAKLCYIESLSINGREIPVTMDAHPELCDLLTLDREFMLSPSDRVRIVTRSRRGAKISATLKISWLS